MLRFYGTLSLILCGVFALAIVITSAVGAQWRSELLIYTGTVGSRHNPTSTDFYLSDVNRRLNTYWMRVDHPVGLVLPYTDGRLAMWVCPENQACDIWVLENEQIVRVTNNLDIHEIYPAWSSDGRLAYWACTEQSQCELSVWDGYEVRTLTQSQKLEGAILMDISLPVWSNDGHLAVSPCDAEWHCDILIWDGITLQNITNTSDRSEIAPVWNSDGRLAYSTCNLDHWDCDIVVWENDEFVSVTNDSLGGKVSATWNETGELAFISCNPIQTCDVLVWDGNIVDNITQTPNSSELYPYWINNDMLAFTSDCQSLSLWDWRSLVTIPVAGLCVRGGGIWSASQMFIYSGCELSVEAICDLMIWDGRKTAHLTNTPRLSEYPAAWLP